MMDKAESYRLSAISQNQYVNIIDIIICFTGKTYLVTHLHEVMNIDQ